MLDSYWVNKLDEAMELELDYLSVSESANMLDAVRDLWSDSGSV